MQTFSFHMTIAAFCSENFVCDENNSMILSVILLMDFILPIRLKSDTDEVAL